jgi:hypothetical protein
MTPEQQKTFILACHEAMNKLAAEHNLSGTDFVIATAGIGVSVLNNIYNYAMKGEAKAGFLEKVMQEISRVDEIAAQEEAEEAKLIAKQKEEAAKAAETIIY